MPRRATLGAQVRARVVEVVYASRRIVHIKTAGIYDDLARGVRLDMRAVHGTRRRPFEVDGFGVIAAAVARALELIFARLPFRRAAEVGAAGENHEDAVRLFNNPNAIGHQEALVDSETEVGRKADAEHGVGLIQSSWKEEPQKHQQVDAKVS